jgi:fatty-acid desaturase
MNTNNQPNGQCFLKMKLHKRESYAFIIYGLLVVFLLMLLVVINGDWYLFYWWILMVIFLMVISGYSINGY